MSNLDPQDRDALHLYTGVLAGAVASVIGTSVELSDFITTPIIFIIASISIWIYRWWLSRGNKADAEAESYNWPSWAS